METCAANVWRLLARRGTWEARVHFLAPFSPVDVPDRKALSARAREVIAPKTVTDTRRQAGCLMSCRKKSVAGRPT
jgi:hypothetical protein